MDDVRTLVLDLAVRYGFQVLGALVILAVGWIVAGSAGRFAERRLRDRMEPPLLHLMVRSLKLLIVMMAAVVALDKFGFQIAPLVAGIGVAGLGISFALQGVLSNVVAGLTIILTKPFRVGEHVATVGVHGDVETIQLFATTLVHPDRSRVIIPNRKIVGEILHNFGTIRQLDVAVTIAHEADVGLALGLAGAVVRENPRALKDPAPVVGVAGVSEAGVTLAVKPWVRVPDLVPATAEVYQGILARFGASGIGAPRARREVVMLGQGANGR